MTNKQIQAQIMNFFRSSLNTIKKHIDKFLSIMKEHIISNEDEAHRMIRKSALSNIFELKRIFKNRVHPIFKHLSSLNANIDRVFRAGSTSGVEYIEQGDEPMAYHARGITFSKSVFRLLEEIEFTLI